MGQFLLHMHGVVRVLVHIDWGTFLKGLCRPVCRLVATSRKLVTLMLTWVVIFRLCSDILYIYIDTSQAQQLAPPVGCLFVCLAPRSQSEGCQVSGPSFSFKNKATSLSFVHRLITAIFSAYEKVICVVGGLHCRGGTCPGTCCRSSSGSILIDG